MIRLISFIMLLISLVTLSGLSVSASAMIQSGAADVCCSGGEDAHDGTDEAQNNTLVKNQEHGPFCYGTGCHCICCLSDDLNVRSSHGLSPILFRTAAESSSDIGLSDFIFSIEYPPEAF